VNSSLLSIKLNLCEKESVDFRKKMCEQGNRSHKKLNKFGIHGKISRESFDPALRTKEQKFFKI
jgi:hypothetical protein